MLLPIALFACVLADPGPPATPRPAEVPPEAIAIRLDADGLVVDGRVVDSLDALQDDLVDGIHLPLREALAGRGDSAWIQAQGDLPWVLVRKLLVSADAAGVDRRWVVDGPRAYGPSHRPRARYRPTCADGPVAVEGLARRVIVDIFHGSAGTWVEASVLFHPRVDGVATLSLPDTCWSGARCEQLPLGQAPCRAAQGAQPAPDRVAVAGPVGCLLPIRKAPGQEAAWPDELAANLTGLGITREDEATLIVEANAPWSTVLAVLEGFHRAGLPSPALGLPLVEGHGRPPTCAATVRDTATLTTAGAKWYGSHL